MRIPFPARIPIGKASIAAAVLACVQVAEGTGRVFVLLHFVFVLLWVFAFNVSGGLRRITGAYVFFFGLFTIVLGTVLRACIGQPGDDVSQAPILTMAIYTGSMAVLALAGGVTRVVMDNVKSFPEQIGALELNYRSAAIGCLALGTFFAFSGLILPASFFGQVFLTIMHVASFLMPLGVLLGTIDAVQSSGGARSITWVSVTAMALNFFIGFLGFSKQGMLTPFACYIVGVAWARFSLRPKHIIALLGFMVFFELYLYPLAQIGRFLYDDEPSIRAQVSDELGMIRDAAIYRAQMREEEMQVSETSEQYFSRQMGFAERMTRWPSDDPLIAFSAKNHYTGYAYLRWTFLNWFPHVVFPDKDRYAVDGGGNYYAREMGWLTDTDTGTGISFGAPAESFHIDGWRAVLVMQPAVWFLFFVFSEFVCGKMDLSPWGTPLIVAVSHIAPEGGITGVVTEAWLMNVSLIAGMIFAVYIAPIIGTVVEDMLGVGSADEGSEAAEILSDGGQTA